MPVGQEEGDGDVEVLFGTGLESDDDELPELRDSDSVLVWRLLSRFWVPFVPNMPVM